MLWEKPTERLERREEIWTVYKHERVLTPSNKLLKLGTRNLSVSLFLSPTYTHTHTCYEYLCFSKILMLKSYPQSDSTRRQDRALMNEIDTLFIKEDWERSPAFSAMWSYSEKTAPMNKESGFHQTVNPPATWFLDFQPLELEGRSFCCLSATYFVVSYYSSPNGLR